VLVEPAYTSQGCSQCGARVQESLCMRTHLCPVCGFGAGPWWERGQECAAGRAGPSWSGGSTRRAEASIHRTL